MLSFNPPHTTVLHTLPSRWLTKFAQQLVGMCPSALLLNGRVRGCTRGAVKLSLSSVKAQTTVVEAQLNIAAPFLLLLSDSRARHFTQRTEIPYDFVKESSLHKNMHLEKRTIGEHRMGDDGIAKSKLRSSH